MHMVNFCQRSPMHMPWQDTKYWAKIRVNVRYFVWQGLAFFRSILRMHRLDFIRFLQYTVSSIMSKMRAVTQALRRVALFGTTASLYSYYSTPSCSAAKPYVPEGELQAFDRTSRLDLHPNLVVIESKAMRALLTTMRDVRTTHVHDFVHSADRLMRMLAEEGLAELPGVRAMRVATPCGVYDGVEVPPANTVAVVSIVRAGDTLLEAVRRIAPAVHVGKILIQRDESTAAKTPVLMYSKLPGDIAQRTVLLVDPMLATGQSAEMAIRELVRRGVREEAIVFLNVVAAPEGLAHMARTFPRVKVVTAAVDEKLNEHMYIVPGLGDYGDRYHGT